MREQADKVLDFLCKYYNLPEAKEEDFLEDIRLCLHGIGVYVTVNQDIEFLTNLDSMRKYFDIKNFNPKSESKYFHEIELYTTYQLYCKIGESFSEKNNWVYTPYYNLFSDFFKKYPNIVIASRPSFFYKSKVYTVESFNIDLETFAEENKDKLVFLYIDVVNNKLTWNEDKQIRAVVIE